MSSQISILQLYEYIFFMIVMGPIPIRHWIIHGASKANVRRNAMHFCCIFTAVLSNHIACATICLWGHWSDRFCQKAVDGRVIVIGPKLSLRKLTRHLGGPEARFITVHTM